MTLPWFLKATSLTRPTRLGRETHCGSSPIVLTAFRTEQQAQEHCPKDTVVWLDPQNGQFELNGHGTYGLPETGRYACRGEAERAGMHSVPNCRRLSFGVNSCSR